MIKATQWQGQDVLRLNEDQWLEVLQDNNMVDDEVLKMIEFVYRQPNCSSTASDIADHFHVHYNQVTAWNRRLSKKLYDKFSQEPPGDLEGTGYRYWNVIFDGVTEQPEDEKKHFYWRLRPNLVNAWRKFLQMK